MPEFVIATSIAAVVLFLTMVLSIMASVEADKKNQVSLSKARSYSIYSAVLAGVAALIIVIGLIIHGLKPELF